MVVYDISATEATKAYVGQVVEKSEQKTQLRSENLQLWTDSDLEKWRQLTKAELRRLRRLNELAIGKHK